MKKEQKIQSTGAYFERLSRALTKINLEAIDKLIRQIVATSDSDGVLWLAGNGGSASTANHMAVDLSLGVTSRRIRAISLCDNLAQITATGNDLDFKDVFSRPFRKLARSGDTLLVISASGSSPNLIRVVEEARSLGLVSAGLLGFNGGKLVDIVDLPVLVPTEIGDYGVAEDAHLALNHAMKEELNRL